MQLNGSNKLKIYNSLSGTKELFKPVSNNNFVGMYVCGPTVYSNVHLGNLRTFTSFDVRTINIPIIPDMTEDKRTLL